MKTYIGLFRGINVGGHNILPMKQLISIFENMNLKNVKTYIQSGNIIFQSEENNLPYLSKTISSKIKTYFGFEPQMLILEKDEFTNAIKNNPFTDAESEPKTLHLNFLAMISENPNLDGLERLRKQNEQFELIDKVFYLKAPDGIGRSKMVANIEKFLGVAVTSRNWRTITEIVAILNGYK